jgi:hypothetical protein
MSRKLSALTRSERKALSVGLCWVLAARAALAWTKGSFPDTRGTLDRLATRLPRIGLTLDEAVWAVTVAARRTPGTRCLAWALALHALLRQAGIAAELRIGVAKSEPGALTAHAWIDCSGRTLSWGDSVESYNVLSPAVVQS